MEARPRPSWQVDLKWVAGIFACVAILISGVIFSLNEITERGRAEPLSSVFIAFLIDGRVTDEEFEAVQAQAAADPSGPVSLSPLDVELPGSEIAGLEREEASLIFAARFTAVLYDEGPEAAEALILEPGPNEDGEPQEAIDLGPTSSLTGSQHSTVRTIFLASLAIVLVLLGPVAFLSRGLGRLGAPAVVVALSAAPLAAFWSLAGNAVGTPGEDEELYAVIGRGLIRDMAGDLRDFFLAIFGIALAWAVIAFVGTLLTPLSRRLGRKVAAALQKAPQPDAPSPSA
ncbi:MAG TPA: hypothetical protein VIW01_13135 [Dehalococcoidia bacterium]